MRRAWAVVGLTVLLCTSQLVAADQIVVPCCSVSNLVSAMAAAAPGDTFLLAGGNFTGCRAITWIGNFTLDGGGNSTIDCGTKITGANVLFNGTHVDVSDQTIVQNLVIQNWGYLSTALKLVAASMLPAGNLTLQNMMFMNGSTAASVTNVTTMISDSLFTQCSGAAALTMRNNNVAVTRTVFRRNSGSASSSSIDSVSTVGTLLTVSDCLFDMNSGPKAGGGVVLGASGNNVMYQRLTFKGFASDRPISIASTPSCARVSDITASGYRGSSSITLCSGAITGNGNYCWLSNLLFTNNSVGQVIAGDSNHIYNATLSQNTATSQLIAMSGGRSNSVHYSTIIGNTAGAIFYGLNGVNNALQGLSYLENNTIIGNTVSGTYFINVPNGGTNRPTNVTGNLISNNVAPNSVFITWCTPSNENQFFYNTFSNNVYGSAMITAGGGGGARPNMFVGNTFSNNTGGGALIYSPNGWTFTVTGCTFTGNTGGVMNAAAGNFLFINSLVQNNTGSSIVNQHDSGSITINGVQFVSNTATQFGGALLLERAVSATIIGATFTSNSAPAGGAIYADLTTITATTTTSTFTGNSANQGGAIYIGPGQTFTATAVSWNFLNNRALSGGAIFATSSYSLARAVFTGNVALGDGGAIFSTAAATLTGCTFTSHRGQNGGAISQNAAALTLISCIFSGNTGINGGALYGISTASGTSQSGVFVNNTATTAGGAAFWQATNRFEMNSTTFIGNSAIGLAGALRISTNSQVDLNNATFSNNTATTFGGAAAAAAGATFNVRSATFTFNRALSNGGAINGASTSAVSVTNATFTGNTASGTGGALNLGGVASLQSCNISRNNATSGGGLASTGTISLKTVAITFNTASQDGGAIRASGGTVTLIAGVTLSFNVAARGAGVACAGCFLNATQATFNANNASQTGAALWCDPSLAATTPRAVMAGVFTNNYAANEPALEASCTACGCCDYNSTVLFTTALRCVLFPGYGNCSYNCSRGYYIDPGYNGEIKCPVTGTVDPLSICPAVHCDPLPTLSFGSISYPNPGNSRTPDIATKTCDNGYASDPTADAHPQCFGPGWDDNGAVPFVCTPESCPTLTVPEHGNVSSTAGAHGQTVRFYCDSGYLFALNETAVYIDLVCDLGAWDRPQPSCTPGPCDNLDAPTDGSFIASCLYTGCTGRYSCDPGYQLIGADIIGCKSPSWNASAPICKAIDCPSLDQPVNGGVSPDHGNTTAVATYSCEPGFAIQGPDQLRCLGPDWYTIRGGRPSRNTSCDPVSCAGLAYPLATSDDCKQRMEYGHQCAVACEKGYEGPRYGVRCAQSSVATSTEGALAYLNTSSTPAPCKQCDAGRYSEDGGKCQDCVNAITDNPGATSLSDCLCVAGFYELVPLSGQCVACPDGGLCTGRRAQPIAAAGYFKSADSYVVCYPKDACEPGNQCATGYKGYACGLCQEDFYKLNGACLPCPHPGYWKVLVAAIGAGIALLIFIPLSRPAARAEHSVEFGSVTIVLNFIQITALFVDLRLPWPKLIRSVMDAFSSLNLNVELMNPECAAKLSFYDKYVLQLMVPIGVLVWFAFVTAVAIVVHSLYNRNRHYNWRSAASKLIADAVGGYLMFLSLAYILVTRATLSLFSCKQQADGLYVLALSPGDACYSDQWHSYIPVAIVAIAIYIVGVPLIFFFALVRTRVKYGKRAAAVNQPTAFYVKRYAEDAWYWELVIMVRKIMVVAVALFLVDRLISAVVLISAVLFVNVVATAVVQPYQWDGHDLVDFAGLLGCLAVLFSGLVVNAPTFTAVVVADTVAVVLVGLTVGVCVLCFIYEVVFHAREFIRIRKVTTPKHTLPGKRVAVVGLVVGDDMAVVYANGAVARHGLEDLETIDPMKSLDGDNEASDTDAQAIRSVARVKDYIATLDNSGHLTLKTLDGSSEEAIAGDFVAVAAHADTLAAAREDGAVMVWRVGDNTHTEAWGSTSSDASKSGAASGEGKAGLKEVWSQAEVASSVARDCLGISATSVVVCTRGMEILQLSIESGAIFGRWHIAIGDPKHDGPDKLQVMANHVVLATRRGHIHVLSIDTGVCRELSLHSGGISSLHHWHDHLFSASYDGSVRIWNLERGLCVFTLRSNLVGFSAMAIHDDCVYLGLEDGVVLMHDLEPAETTLKIFKPVSPAIWRGRCCRKKTMRDGDNDDESFGKLLATQDVLELELMAETRALEGANASSQLQALAILAEYTQDKE